MGLILEPCLLSSQEDISRGRQMVDSLFQGGQGMGGTHNAIMSSTEYLSTAKRDFNNISDGFYISPAFLDKMTIHVAKNFMDLPKIKVPLILGIWGGKGQGKTFQASCIEARYWYLKTFSVLNKRLAAYGNSPLTSVLLDRSARWLTRS